ncbi:MAG: YfhO family protein [Bryobacteraceae bacterium]|jgi:hypothetical protein
MPKAGRRPTKPAAPVKSEVDWLRSLTSGRAVWGFFAIAAILFYAAPLFEHNATVQWDAADYHLSVQKYFADHIRAGQLPHWTPYPYSGMPFLADTQVGAWYPLNWPFFPIGITPRAIEWELALHCFLALAGGFFLAREFTRDTVAALFAGVLYAFSGFFAAHSSHVGMFQTAALLPWLILGGVFALRRWRWLPVAAAIAGVTILAGHFQSALYALSAYALFLIAYAFATRIVWWRVAVVLFATAVIALGLTAIQTLPGLELTSQSIRAQSNFSNETNGVLLPGALVTLADPDHYNAPGVDNYTGPPDITQFYFYQGVLLLPLAALGAFYGKLRIAILAPAVCALWYALGPAAGLYLLVARLPGFRSIRAPVHAWFVAALALALLAACGVEWLRQRFRYRWLPIALLAFFAGDLWYWNMANNHLAYARASFEDMYGSLAERFQSVTSSTANGGLRRLWAPSDSQSFGPLNSMLDQRLEVTYGYNPLELARYSKYLNIAEKNPRLLDTLAVTAKLDKSTGLFDPNPTALPRVSAPRAAIMVNSREEAAAQLASLDPAANAIVEGSPVPIGPVTARISGYTESEYRIDYQAPGAALLRIAVPYFPGWLACVDGRALPIIPVDLALSGVVVPAGTHQLILRYESTWFRTGAIISAVFWIAIAAWLILERLAL